MASMTPRERFHAALSGQPTDRVPFWLLFPYHAVSYYVDVRNHPLYRPIHEAAFGKAIALNRRGLNVPLFTDAVAIGRESRDEGGGSVRRTTYSMGDAKVWSDTRIGSEGAVRVKPLLNNEEDLATFASFPVLDDEREIARHLESQLPAYLAERKDFPSDAGEMMLELGEPINPIYHSADLEEFALWSLTCPEVMEGLLERFMRQRRIVYKWCLERELAAAYFLIGSELAAPPLVSRATFQRWIVPHAKGLIGMIRQAGAKAVQHYHGQIRDLLPDFRDMGADALHTIEAPPTGNCTMTEAYAGLGDRIALIGNVQYDRFRAATAEEMAAETRAVIDECRGRRFILSPSAGPYESEADPAIFRNYRVFIDTAWNAPWP